MAPAQSTQAKASQSYILRKLSRPHVGIWGNDKDFLLDKEVVS